MAEAGLVLQKAIYDTLTADAALMTLVTGVFDHVPGGTNLPYVVIGEATAADWSTKDMDGQRHTVSLHVWAQGRGQAETKTIMARIYGLLHRAELTLENETLVLFRFDFSEALLDADGMTHHGILRFRAFTHG